MSGAYYNEHDPFAAEWLRNLIFFGHIAPGDVDERSIEDVCADDLKGYAQHHFFAGIGVWSYALRQAGWPDDRPVWTASCPCPPFSSAGKKKQCPECAGQSSSLALDELASSYAAHATTHGLPMAATSGPKFGASASVALTASLASRYRALTDGCGSTLFAHRWKCWATPLAYSIPALRATAPHISGKGSTGAPSKADAWSTPRANKRGFPDAHGSREGPLVSGYNTPRATDGSNGGPNQSGGALPADVALAGWPTTTTRTERVRQSARKDGRNSLRTTASWATPNATDCESAAALNRLA